MSKKKIAVFPGSFDPITKGHESIVRKAAPLFDELIVAIGQNSEKSYMFDLDQRKKWILETFKDLSNIKVDAYSGLTVDFCKKKNAFFIVRGLRSSSDYNYEKNIGLMNKALNSKIETLLFLAEPEHIMISSSVIREIISYNGKVDKFLPECIKIDNRE